MQTLGRGPEGFVTDGLASLEGKRIATSYPGFLARKLAEAT